jgi:hypothetical protein
LASESPRPKLEGSIDRQSVVRQVGYRQASPVSAPVSAIVLDENQSSDKPSIHRNEGALSEAGLEVESAENGFSEAVGAYPLESALGTQQPVAYFVSLALSRHPKIRAARQQVAAAANVAPQVSALPDPMFNNIFWPIQSQALQTAGGRVGNQFQLSQSVPWPEKLRTR